MFVLPILYQKTLSSQSLTKTSLQGAVPINPLTGPPVRPWDNKLVLSILQRFLGLETFCWKTSLVKLPKVAITSVGYFSELAALFCFAQGQGGFETKTFLPTLGGFIFPPK